MFSFVSEAFGGRAIGLFGPSRFLDADIEDWLLETWAWLMANLGGMARIQGTPLVLPTREFYPPTDAVGHERALYVFEQTKRLMGIAERACRLEALDSPREDQFIGTYAKLAPGKRANGTFRIEDGEVIISYASKLVDDPRGLIATLAHELSHYLLATIRKPMPGGMQLHELATDLTVAFAGFGVFGANHAFTFAQHQDAFGQGWQAGRNGYLSERSWAFALALFAALKDVEVPREQLKGSVADLTRKATRYLAGNPARLAPLQAIAS
ncbi:MAG TPA: hypothetical protein VGL58_13440 [Caulobacteraceae bacterium]|jgi:hypothetical protein